MAAQRFRDPCSLDLAARVPGACRQRRVLARRGHARAEWFRGTGEPERVAGPNQRHHGRDARGHEHGSRAVARWHKDGPLAPRRSMDHPGERRHGDEDHAVGRRSDAARMVARRPVDRVPELFDGGQLRDLGREVRRLATARADERSFRRSRAVVVPGLGQGHLLVGSQQRQAVQDLVGYARRRAAAAHDGRRRGEQSRRIARRHEDRVRQQRQHDLDDAGGPERGADRVRQRQLPAMDAEQRKPRLPEWRQSHPER